MMITTPKRHSSLGLRLCQLAVPVLAIPSALGINSFFSVVDGVAHPTPQGVVAAAGFELANIGLSLLDVRRPELHARVRQARFWSVAAAIAMNVIAHYAVASAGESDFQFIPLLLAVVASAPLALLYVGLAAIIHAISEGDQGERATRAAFEGELRATREELTGRDRELAQAREELAHAREQAATRLARAEAAARETQGGLAAELAQAREELVQAREREGVLREQCAAEVQAAHAAAHAATGEATVLRQEVAALRTEVARLGDRSRQTLMREARGFAAERGWGASEIGRALGWPESTVRGWLAQAGTEQPD